MKIMRFSLRNRLHRISIMLLLWLFLPVHIACAADYTINLIGPDEGHIYKRFNKAFQDEVARLASEHRLNINLVKPESPVSPGKDSLIVTVGNKASRKFIEDSTNPNVLSAFISRQAMSELDINTASKALYIDFPPRQYLELVRFGLPDSKRVGVLLGEKRNIDLQQLHKDATELGLELIAKRVASEREVLPELKKMARDVDVFLAIPDRLVHNRRTARGVLLMTYKHQIPVAAYSRAYVDAGASLALFATPENIAIATANIAVSKVTGKNDIDCLEKTTLSVKTNSHVSKLLRLNMHPEKTIRDALLKRLEGCAYE